MTSNNVFFSTFKDVPGHFVELLIAESNMTGYDQSPQGVGFTAHFHPEGSTYHRDHNIYYPRGLTKGKNHIDMYIKIARKDEDEFFSCTFEIIIMDDKENTIDSSSFCHPRFELDVDWEKLFKKDNEGKYATKYNFFNSIIDEYGNNEQFKHQIDELLDFGVNYVN
ncbi:MAG: hypothetical protein Terrestrivirus1_156 [Terrestrivirus sp.]|uniref:Uncharacterized protein n=1 Tax=Terrestrivirus sp. TaxID=2487775 RepID=A0A3G4ZKB4_9VIRU|nr:MAG: hypothetical protein Terrestrivirus1_156 [Terrestrivirus sp.]